MIEGARVFVVVPAFREAQRLARVLDAMPASVEHVIVVDDASDDGTFDIARASADPRVIAIAHEKNRGVGAAIATGYRHACATRVDGSAAGETSRTPRDPSDARDAFVVMAGDGQMDPRDLPALVAPIARGEADYVKGNRFAWAGARSAIPRARFIGGHIFSALTRAALDLEIDDSQCGYTAISRAACERIDLDALWPRFGYPNDLLAMLSRARIRIAEVPVRPVYITARNKLGARHVPIIAAVIARAWWRRAFTSLGQREP